MSMSARGSEKDKRATSTVTRRSGSKRQPSYHSPCRRLVTNITAHPNPAKNCRCQQQGLAETGLDRQNPFCMKIFYDSTTTLLSVFAKDKAGKAEKNKAETADNKKPAQGPVFHATT
ncbi:MAG: hypothetical protein ACRC02_13895 [Vogesella sp.]|uniref:hypothetical protein n=1 Tax=Vogesella sp. TaxID=1904252 RepID=UPI003F385632